MHQHTQMDLFSTKAKRPLSEAPRHGSRLNQRALQVEGEFAQCDPHPVYEGLFYYGKQVSGGQRWCVEDRWIKDAKTTPSEVLAKRQAAVEYNLTKPDHEPPVHEEGLRVGKINQYELQVAWKPMQGDSHPVYVNYRYSDGRNGKQYWLHREAFERRQEQAKDWRCSPKGLEMKLEYVKRYTEKKPEACSSYRSIWVKAHEEYLEGVITLEERDKAWAFSAYKTKLNEKIADIKDKWNLDHIVPETHGGLTTVQNLQLVSASWNKSKGNRNRHVKGLQGSDYDVWYHTPYAFPKCREWTLSLADKEITKLTFVPNPRDS